MTFPQMANVEQIFDDQHILDVPAKIIEEMAGLKLYNTIRCGETVAVTGGSRGITDIDVITKTMVAELKRLGAKPFIFPAMGSHGGATAEGQKAILASLGITEEFVGCPIKSDMEPEYLGTVAEDYPLYVDRNALAADHIVVVNRVKAHTKFKGPIESGLMKMMSIGMGKQIGASFYHRAAVRLTFQSIIETVGLEVIQRCPVLFGLGIVENAYHKIIGLKAINAENILNEEKKLLTLAKEKMATLPFDDIDVLIIDQIGKDISGTGMDINVIGRNYDILSNFISLPRVKRIFVRDLSKKSEGNAIGIGLADFTTSRLVKKMDNQKTWVNSITGISPEKGAIPIYFDKDQDALLACFQTIGDVSAADARVVHIKNTLELHHFSVSRAYAAELEAHQKLHRISEWKTLSFNSQGNLE